MMVMLTVVMMMIMQITMSVVNCYSSDGGDAVGCGDDDGDNNADNNVCCKLLQQ